MAGWRPVLTGALALLVWQTLVASREGADRVGGAIGDLTRGISRLIDPTVPAIAPRADQWVAPSVTPQARAALANPTYPAPNQPAPPVAPNR